MRFTKTTLAALIAGIVTAGNAAAAEPAPAVAAEPAPVVAAYGNLTFTNAYLFRGLDVTEGKPAIQGFIHLAGNAGGYGGLWMSNVSGNVFHNGNSEMYFYGGKNWDIGSGYTLDTGFAHFIYPNAKYSSLIDGKEVKYDTTELKLGVKKGIYEAVLWYGTSKHWAGFDFNNAFEKSSLRGTTYVELNANPELAKGVTLNLHAGKQSIKDLSDWSWTDYKIGVTFDVSSVGLKGWTASAAVLHNSGDEALYKLINADTGTALNVSLSKNF